ncbi:MAG: histidine phosphatase family protein [Actinomyces sp.]|nr:histidine phosphatase family protein [Actinomyces sp.]MCI1788902.1 histidine phosphatase family protein [Actinomyces sp.]
MRTTTAARVVLLRHGQTDFNAQGRFQGASDIPLNDTGRAQARCAGQLLAHRLGSGGMRARIACSPLARARETARIIAGELEAAGIRPVDEGGAVMPGPAVDDRLIERSYGLFEGLTRAEIEREMPDAFATWRRTGECAEADIESSQSTGERMRAAVEAHARGWAGSTLVIVSHGSAIVRGVEMMIGLDPLTFTGLRGLDNCHWSELVPGQAGDGWRLAAHNLGPIEGVLRA